MFSKCLILWISYLVSSSNASTVPWIQPCTPVDSACLLKSAEYAKPYFVKGDKTIGIPSIDPLPIKDTIYEEGGLKIMFRNLKIHQLSQCKIESLTRDLGKSTANIIMNCPTVLKGDYTMSGKILALDVSGDGPFSIDGGRMRSSVDIKVKKITKDDKKHYKVSSFDYKFELISKYTLTFVTLFNGDKAKAEPVEKVMNDSWKELMLTIGNPIIKNAMTLVVSYIDKLFMVMSAEELEIV